MKFGGVFHSNANNHSDHLMSEEWPRRYALHVLVVCTTLAIGCVIR